jgi:hypothetical protein
VKEIIMKKILALGVIAEGLCGCSTAPLSFIVDRGVLDRTDIHRIPVRLVAVDGESVAFRRQPIAPGQHELTFDAAPVPGFHIPVTKTYPMAILPCSYYYVAADRANRLTSDWNLVVEEVDQVGGCNPEQEMQKAGAVPRPNASLGSSALVSMASR